MAPIRTAAPAELAAPLACERALLLANDARSPGAGAGAVPHGLDPRFINPNYGTRDVLFGARWLFDSKLKSYAYIEARTGASIAVDGSPEPDILTLGLRLSYSLRDGLGQ